LGAPARALRGGAGRVVLLRGEAGVGKTALIGRFSAGLAAVVAMAFKLIESAQRRWRLVNASRLVALVQAGAEFKDGKLVQRSDNHDCSSSRVTRRSAGCRDSLSWPQEA
jgi:predicted ATP-dependent serine protease